MELSYDLQCLKEPKKMLGLGILLLAIGAFMFVGLDWNDGVTRENCVMMELTLDDCKYRSGDKGLDSNSIYLTFRDYSDHLDIHSSCADDKLTQDLMELRSGTKMKLVVSEETRHIYEISVDGETWLTFEDAIKKINNNMEFGKYIGCVTLAVGTVFVLTVLVSVLWSAFKKKKLAGASRDVLLLK